MKNRNVFLTSVLLVSSFVSAFSGFGSGTDADPYVVTTVEQLQEMQDELSASYVLGNDIDASATSGWNDGKGFKPVGRNVSGEYFTGVLSGDGYIISDLYINRPSRDGAGLFGYVTNGVIREVGLVNAQVYGDFRVGSLAGICSWRSLVENCWASGEVIISADGNQQAQSGGLVGVIYSSTLSQCYSAVNVTALSSRQQVGGLCGYLRGVIGNPQATIENCYSVGTVTCDGRKTGGLLGDADGGNAIVSKCYSTGRVNGSSKKGLIGFNYRDPQILDSYWDVETSGCDSSVGGIGKTTIKMKQQATFADWDFVNIWSINEGYGYPLLGVPGVLESLEISGTEFTVEGSSVQFTAIARFDNMSVDVTGLTAWFVGDDSTHQFADGGILMTGAASLPRELVTILAEYSHGDQIAQAQFEIEVIALCPTGSALEFDGVDDFVNVGNDGIGGIFSDDSTAFTVLAWINPAALSAEASKHGTRNVFFSCAGIDSNDNFEFGVSPDGSLDVYIDENHDNIAKTYGDGEITTGQWHYVACSFDHGSVEVCIDGSYYNGNFAGSHLDPAIGTPVTIGATLNSGIYFNGMIDEVAVFHRSLTPEEIEANKFVKFTGEHVGARAYWEFSEGSGQAAHDSTMNGHDGYLGYNMEMEDESDPVWIAPGAPVGICSLEGFVELNLNRAISHKTKAMEELSMAIERELIVKNALDMISEHGHQGKAKGNASGQQKINSAIMFEEQAQRKIEMSLKRLAELISDLMND